MEAFHARLEVVAPPYERVNVPLAGFAEKLICSIDVSANRAGVTMVSIVA